MNNDPLRPVLRVEAQQAATQQLLRIVYNTLTTENETNHIQISCIKETEYNCIKEANRMQLYRRNRKHIQITKIKLTAYTELTKLKQKTHTNHKTTTKK